MAELADKPVHPVVALRDYLQGRVDTFKTTLPPHINPDRFIAAAMTAAQLNPDLIACDRRSLFLALVRCAQDGLLPDGQEAAIVPYKTKATYIPMYRGLLKKFRNSGQFKWVTAGIVYEGETYEHWIDESGEHFKHVPGDDNTGKKKRRIYALATTKDGGSFIADLPMSDINKRKAISRASRDDAPWKQWPDEMEKKTALRVLYKLLPSSSDLEQFMTRDEQESLGIEAPPVEAVRSVEHQGGSALDHFEGSDSSETSPPGVADASPNDDGAGESGGAQGTSETTTPTVSAAAPFELDAHKRGQQAKAEGHSRKAVPPDFREGGLERLAAAWLAGYDGKDLPQ